MMYIPFLPHLSILGKPAYVKATGLEDRPMGVLPPPELFAAPSVRHRRALEARGFSPPGRNSTLTKRQPPAVSRQPLARTPLGHRRDEVAK
eukprot:2267837-Pyramimonas_sp.AAC.2